jgi:hypothetical protein
MATIHHPVAHIIIFFMGVMPHLKVVCRRITGGVSKLPVFEHIGMYLYFSDAA